MIDRPHIGIFGRMNVGKSSLFNVLGGQKVSIVDDTPGTTTDPVRKILEIEDFGPAALIDTGGVDDIDTELGKRRVAKSLDAAGHVDLAVIVFDGEGLGKYEENLAEAFKARNTPFFFVRNKSDLGPVKTKPSGADVLEFSSKNPDVPALVALIKKHLGKARAHNMFDGLIKEGDLLLLVTPIDEEAPAGRMILPQVQALRAGLDKNAVVLFAQVPEVESVLKRCPGISLAVTDSQAFAEVSKIVPANIPLTSFSILLSRAKGNFEDMVKGARKIAELKDGDKILMLESCTHTVNLCVDIGRTKIPAWLQKHTGKKLAFKVAAGLEELPEDLKNYALAIQCGGCMATKKQLHNRIEAVISAGVPVTNYGMAIACCNGILDRVLRPFERAALDSPSIPK